MKGLVFGLLVACSLLHCSEGGMNCFGRTEQLLMKKMSKENMCPDPSEKIIPIPVPDGAYKVIPPIVRVKRCDGFCLETGRACLPTKYTTKMFMIEVTTNVTKMECNIEKVEEHLKCGCQCEISQANCTIYQEFDEESCSCLCSEKARDLCRGNGAMWKTAECLCIPHSGP
ncbi:uncharacterized protein LOC135198133 [Macrobrachium nipponense]|uniref:uncharacterized protein LOC135198133 n=1 Tax=Macrobrachium nipponense TaxID=159736 RepID=UPI0030C804CA